MVDNSKFLFIDQVIARQRGRVGALLGILEAVQEHNPRKYLCADELRYIAAQTDLPLAQIFSVVTFYALFNLEPQGDHTICICRGTACHTRGSRSLLQRLRLELGLPEESEDGADKLCVTTPDRRYSLRTVACFGQCALAPVVEVDHAHLRPHERAGACIVRWSTRRRSGRHDPHPGHRHVQRGARGGDGEAAAPRPRIGVGMGTCGARQWRRGRVSRLRRGDRASDGTRRAAGRRSAASASARRSRWSMCGCRAVRW